MSKGFEKVTLVKPIASVPGKCDCKDQLRGETVKNCDKRWYFYYEFWMCGFSIYKLGL